MSALIVWALSVPRYVLHALAFSAEAWTNVCDTSSWAEAVKKIVAPAKMHHGMNGADLKPIFEMSLLVNRNQGDVDWEEQKRIRTNSPVIELPKGLVRTMAAELFKSKRNETFRYPRMTAQEMWRTRLMTIPTGSVHSQFKEYTDIKEWSRTYRSKKYALSSRKNMEFEKLISRKPEVFAWPSIKYEHAKARPIYGTDMNSYLIHELAARDIEYAFPDEFAMGNNGMETEVTDKINQIGQTGIPFCFDFEDFNTQHSLQSQAEAMQGYFDVYRADMSEDQKRAADWTVESLMNQKIRFEDGDVDVKYGLFSGLRYTTVINSVLNKIYMVYGGLEPTLTPTLHLGDDVISYMDDLWTALDLMNGTKLIGVRANPAKCAIGGTAEFLRVDRSKNPIGARQYICRSISTLVTNRPESREALSGRDILRAHLGRVMEIKKRGAADTAVEPLITMFIDRISKMYLTDPDTLLKVIETDAVCGGLVDNGTGAIDVIVEEENVYDDAEWTDVNTWRPGIVDATEEVRKQLLPHAEFITDIFRAYADMVRSAGDVAIKRITIRQNDDTAWYKNQMNWYGVCKNDKRSRRTWGVIRSAALTIDKIQNARLSKEAMMRLEASKKPIITANIIF